VNTAPDPAWVPLRRSNFYAMRSKGRAVFPLLATYPSLWVRRARGLALRRGADVRGSRRDARPHAARGKRSRRRHRPQAWSMGYGACTLNQPEGTLRPYDCHVQPCLALWRTRGWLVSHAAVGKAR
jgi:hypothetical protein